MTEQTTSIEQIASVHLGRAGDGSVVKPYVTPDSIDKTLLVAIPRYLNRTAYGIRDDDLPFDGFDTWNCYEVSALTESGYPVSGVLRLCYSAKSKSIVESKSLKLYLNSFNMVRLDKSIRDVASTIETIVKRDLSELLQTEVDVCFHLPFDETSSEGIVATPLETCVNVEEVDFNDLVEGPELLEVVVKKDPFPVHYTTNVLRSNCRVTNQPDWGDLYVFIDGPQSVTPESLLRYIVSMRRKNHFHEEIVECVAKHLIDALPSCEVGVCALYTRRGGIDINPVRGNTTDAIMEYAHALARVDLKQYKTDRQ